MFYFFVCNFRLLLILLCKNFPIQRLNLYGKNNNIVWISNKKKREKNTRESLLLCVIEFEEKQSLMRCFRLSEMNAHSVFDFSYRPNSIQFNRFTNSCSIALQLTALFFRIRITKGFYAISTHFTPTERNCCWFFTCEIFFFCCVFVVNFSTVDFFFSFIVVQEENRFYF